MDKKIYVLMMSVFLMLAGAVHAREFKNIHLADEILLEGANESISLNGVGMRTKFFFDIYIGALYLEAAASTLEEVVSQQGSKRVLMHFIYDEVSSEKLVAGWNEGFEENLSDEQFDGLAERIKAFNAMFDTVRKGDVVCLDYLPNLGTRVIVKGVEKGVIEGEDFSHALLSIWLDDEPADYDLKEAMLNVKN